MFSNGFKWFRNTLECIQKIIQSVLKVDATFPYRTFASKLKKNAGRNQTRPSSHIKFEHNAVSTLTSKPERM